MFWGDINGQNIFDGDPDEQWEQEQEYLGQAGLYRPRGPRREPWSKEFIWFSHGKKFRLHEMSDEHLQNAYDYAVRNNHKQYVIDTLAKEIKDRPKRKFMEQTRQCPFCHCEMDMHKLDLNECEVGWGLSYTYRFVCDNCGAQSDAQEFNG